MLQAHVAISNGLRQLVRRVDADERGQSMVEYGLLAMLIAVGVIAAVTLVGGRLQSVFNSIANSL